MKRLSLGTIRAQAEQAWQKFLGQRLFRDRLSVGMLSASLACNLLAFLYLFLKLRPSDFAVPIHYTSLGGFDALGPWYQIYTIAAFGLAVSVANGFFAIKSFGRSRITSFFLLASAFVVSVLCLIISIAFAAIT